MPQKKAINTIPAKTGVEWQNPAACYHFHAFCDCPTCGGKKEEKGGMLKTAMYSLSMY